MFWRCAYPGLISGHPCRVSIGTGCAGYLMSRWQNQLINCLTQAGIRSPL